MSWQPPSLLDGRVLRFNAFLSADAAGVAKSQITSVAVGSNVAPLPAETSLQSFQYVTVYSESALEVIQMISFCLSQFFNNLNRNEMSCDMISL